MRAAVGLDGCRGGWVAAVLKNTSVTLKFLTAIEEIETLLPHPLGLCHVAVDMPIGLPHKASWQGRKCDQAARRALGKRRASIFPPPSRELLEIKDFSQLKGSGLSIQSFNLFSKIREVDHYLDPKKQTWLRETHPELVFSRLGGEPSAFSKKTPEGRLQRRLLLKNNLGRIDWPSLPPHPPGLSATCDDVLDALALAVAARDRARGHGLTFPEGESEFDERGLRMEICF